MGVDQYADPTIRNLAFPSEDATELASVFKRLMKFDRVEKLINPRHSPDVVDAVNDMTRGLGSGDLFLFFFAGHGFRVKENHVLVCAQDEYADLKDEYAGLRVGRLYRDGEDVGEAVFFWRSMRGFGTDLSILRHPFRTRLSSLAEAACAASKLFSRFLVDI